MNTIDRSAAKNSSSVPDSFAFCPSGIPVSLVLNSTYGNLKPGEIVVIQGAGGVSIFELQIAHVLGACVMVIARP